MIYLLNLVLKQRNEIIHQYVLHHLKKIRESEKFNEKLKKNRRNLPLLMTITIFLLLFLLGIITGFYSGLIGTGGNIILIPALDILLTYYHIEGNELVKFVIAHSLFITMFIGFSVSYKQYKINNFHYREVLLIGIPGMLISYIVSEIIKTATWYDKFYFDIVFF